MITKITTKDIVLDGKVVGGISELILTDESSVLLNKTKPRRMPKHIFRQLQWIMCSSNENNHLTLLGYVMDTICDIYHDKCLPSPTYIVSDGTTVYRLSRNSGQSIEGALRELGSGQENKDRQLFIGA